jgi:hypothetical protein
MKNHHVLPQACPSNDERTSSSPFLRRSVLVAWFLVVTTTVGLFVGKQNGNTFPVAIMLVVCSGLAITFAALIGALDRDMAEATSDKTPKVEGRASLISIFLRVVSNPVDVGTPGSPQQFFPAGPYLKQQHQMYEDLRLTRKQRSTPRRDSTGGVLEPRPVLQGWHQGLRPSTTEITGPRRPVSTHSLFIRERLVFWLWWNTRYIMH